MFGLCLHKSLTLVKRNYPAHGRGAGESLADYAKALKLLTEGAYPDRAGKSQSKRDRKAIRTFTRGLSNKDLRVYVLDKDPPHPS